MKEANANAKKKGSADKATKGRSSENTKSGSNKAKSQPQAAAAPQAPVIEKEPTLPASNGALGVFGGPKDKGLKPDDKLALPTGPHSVYERVRTLNPKSFYCAMRWNYHVEHLTPEEVRRWWANKKLLVTGVKSGKAVVVRAVDYGPHESTGLAISVSPGAADALGAEVGDEVNIALADAKLPLGPTE